MASLSRRRILIVCKVIVRVVYEHHKANPEREPTWSMRAARTLSVSDKVALMENLWRNCILSQHGAGPACAQAKQRGDISGFRLSSMTRGK